MPAAFLLPETVIHENGESGALDLGAAPPRSLLVTLGIAQVIEQQSLALTIEGSADGAVWHPLVRFPLKFYTGLSSVLVDVAGRPEVRFVRACWKVDRWGRGTKLPLFRIYVAAEDLSA